MFEEETVFILGAGASKPYGFPLGVNLIKRICSLIKSDRIFFSNSKIHILSNFSQNIENFKNTLDTILDEFENKCTFGDLTCKSLKDISDCSSLKERINEYDPVSIDSFLRDHSKEFGNIGKIMIIYTLLSLEERKLFQRREENDNWYPMILDDITSGCTESAELIKENKLKIITFNYDISLESYLFEKINDISFFNDHGKNFIKNLINNNTIHVYGQVNKKLPEENEYGHFNRDIQKERKIRDRLMYTSYPHGSNLESGKPIRTIISNSNNIKSAYLNFKTRIL